MRILTRNTVFKTAVLTGLLSCLLVLAGAFFGITASVHAMHGFIHAEDVGTDQANLEKFVQDAVDAYYIDFIIRECDFSKISKLEPFQSLIPDLSIAPVDQIKPLIRLFPQAHLTRADIDEGCDFTHRFDEVFGMGEGDWKSGSIYLFVMDDEGKMLFHGADPSLEGKVLAAVDEGKRDVIKLIIDEAETPSTSNPGIVEYCWDDPDVEDDEILDSNGKPIAGKAHGDSWKKSYVVDPFVYLGAPALSSSLGVIFGSGIYPDPETGTAPPGCDGNGMADYDGDDMDYDGDDMDYDGDDMDGDGDDMDGDGDGIVGTVKDAVESGGCAIAAGSDRTPQGTAFNLLLIVSALFLALSFGNRVVGRRNGVRS